MFDMRQSPLVQELLAECSRKLIKAVLKDRFGAVPRDVAKLLQGVVDERRLIALNVLAGTCPDMDGFRKALLSRPDHPHKRKRE